MRVSAFFPRSDKYKESVKIDVTEKKTNLEACMCCVGIKLVFILQFKKVN